ncbi:transporter substrate-binding domain-containing protein [Pseudalkalibacillus salsuginis]|uniref:transporter substrate-binding domain-containing protein n=1 Tax=Pseudalkalibacillus salsuginis TaxID=2910972 RepID=UPI001F1FDB9E|nr:transporter substrate-binding domain-containing protein [Pseudalkalibacillus salsuginis]MCF6408684.1 transporter substrate-binding domain-containing protein [Pseudalkalibacillus salsuginis]
MRKVSLWAVMILLFSMLLAACGGGSEDGDGANGEYDLKEDGKFTYASSGEFKPFSSTDANGEMTGFDIEVAEAIAKELGLEPNPQKFKFASIVEGVKTGRFDAAVASHTINEERAEHVDFSIPYYYSGPQIFTRSDSDIETKDDLKDKEIAVSKGSTYAKSAEEMTDNIKIYDSDVTALEALSEGKHDAVITDFITGKEAIGNGFNIEGKELLGRSEQAIAVAKDNDKLLKDINAALEKLREDGTLKKLSEKYFGDDITSDPEGK